MMSIIAVFWMVLFACGFVTAHPGHAHSSPATDDSSLNSLTYNQRVSYGFLVIVFALIGTLIGSLIPLIDVLLIKIHAKPLSTRNFFDRSMIYLFNEVRSYRFTSHSLGFSAGVLVYGVMALMLPGSYNLLSGTTLGQNAQMVTFALWLAGIGIMALLNFLVEVFLSDSHGSCTCQIDLSETIREDKGKDDPILPISNNDSTTIPQSANVYLNSNDNVDNGNSTAITKIENDIDNDFAQLEYLGKFTAVALAIHKVRLFLLN
jgi:hypothetical protein